MFEPLMMSKEVFQRLPKAHQDIIMAVGAEQEKFATDAARADDTRVAEVYTKAGAKCYDIDGPTLAKWQAIARATAWKDYAARSESCKTLIAAAQKLL
jgi:TRAP-type C4-dicarboxylate transport system substrate-binding protein